MLLGGHDLSSAITAQDLIPGSVDQIDKTITALVAVGVPAAEVANLLPKLGSDTWTGPAADAFRAMYTPQPPVWTAIGTGLNGLSDALMAWRDAVEHAQGEAWVAKGEWLEAKALTDASVASHDKQVAAHDNAAMAARMGILPPPPPVPALDDLGASLRQQAEQRLAAARAAVGAAEDTAIVALAAARENLPDAPDALHRFGEDVVDGARTFSTQAVDAGKGVADAVLGMAKGVSTINPFDPQNVTHPEQYMSTMLAIGKGVGHDVAHPLDTLQSMADSTAQGILHDPGRFIGELLPNIAIGVVTGGAGEIAAGAGEIAAGAAETAGAVAEEATGLSMAATDVRGAVASTAGDSGAVGPASMPPVPHSTGASTAWGSWTFGPAGADAVAAGGMEQAGAGLSQVDRDLAGIHVSGQGGGPTTTPPGNAAADGVGLTPAEPSRPLAVDPAATRVSVDSPGSSSPPAHSASRTTPWGSFGGWDRPAAVAAADQAASADVNSAAAGLGTVERDLAQIQIHPQASSALADTPGLSPLQQRLAGAAVADGQRSAVTLSGRVPGEVSSMANPGDAASSALSDPRPVDWQATAADRAQFRQNSLAYEDHLPHVRALQERDATYLGVPVEDLVAIREYTMYSEEMNSALRSGDAPLAAHAPLIRSAASGLRALPNYLGTVSRGIYIDDPAALARVADRYQPGALLQEPAFTSTSVGKSMGGNLFFEIYSKTGTAVGDLAYRSSEAEVLFGPGTPFRVLARTLEPSGAWIIRMMEIG